jgi:hypothetical protein
MSISCQNGLSIKRELYWQIKYIIRNNIAYFGDISCINEAGNMKLMQTN